MMNFIAIDLETANSDMASICQIGIARCKDGVIIEEWSTYVDPEDEFDRVNVSIHGIDETAVEGYPPFSEFSDTLRSYLEGNVVVCHTHFDRVALHKASERYNVDPISCIWLDSAMVVRRTWKNFVRKGYGLHDVCKFLEYDFKHHDALQDAKAVAHIMVVACDETGLDISGWLKRVEMPIDSSASRSSDSYACEGNPDGPLYDEVIVFTGALEVPRREAADLAAALGCHVSTNVNKETTLLVVGDQDLKRLAGHNKSSKHRKAEELIRMGYPIRIIKESDFLQLIKA